MSNIKIPNFVDYFQQDICLISVNRTLFILVFFLSSHSFSFDGILIILLRCSSGISSATSCSKSSSLTEASRLEVKLDVIVLLFVRKFHWGLFLIIFLLHCWMSLLVNRFLIAIIAFIVINIFCFCDLGCDIFFHHHRYLFIQTFLILCCGCIRLGNIFIFVAIMGTFFIFFSKL